ncbi:MAG: TolC family protein [Gemmataceae bacterium]
MLDVAAAYFSVQQARGELAIALLAVKHAEELAKRTESLAKGLAPPAELNRANTELGRRTQVAAAARERWRTASAELARLLRLDPTALVEPLEPASLPITVIDANASLDSLIPIALSTRPELEGSQAVVQATLARLKQEKLRPLIPSLAIRSASTNPSASLGYGVFGGGRNGDLGNFGGRFDIDVQLLWEFQALGFGNRARVHERRAEQELATLELFRTQDRVAAEVAAAFAQVKAASERVTEAEPALREAAELVKRTVEGLGQTRRAGDVLFLVVRPQEAVAGVQAFAQAGNDYFTAVADYNRAQFRLYRALGHPAQCLASPVAEPSQEPAK